MTFLKEYLSEWPYIEDAEEREFNVRGLPTKKGNIATEGSVLDPVPFRAALENARSLQRSITGAETTGILTDPGTGHIHDEGFDAAMPWCQIESYRLPVTAFGGSSAAIPNRLGYVCSSTSYLDVLFVPLVIPLGQTKVVPVFYVKISNSNTLTLKFDFYATSDLTTSVAGSEISIGPGNKDGGVVSDETGFDLSGVSLSISGLTGFRVVYLRVQAKVSASTAVLREVTVRYPFRDYRQKEERTEVDTTQLEADLIPSAATLKKLFCDNPLFLRRSIFGDDNRLPSRSYAHDHGEGRGLPLRRHQLSVAYGPYNFADSGATSGGDVGIPITYPLSGSFVTTPKLLAVHILPISGQVHSLVCFVGAYLAGVVPTRTFDLTLEIRPLDRAFNSPDAGDSITAPITLSRLGDGFTSGLVSFGSLATLGSIGQDRLFELCIWQTSDVPSTETYRLTGLCAYTRFTGTYAADSLMVEGTLAPATESVPVIRIRENQDVTNLLTAQWATVTNQLQREALGGVGGLRKDLSTSNTSKPWKRKIREVHQHRGSFTDSITGEIIDDGAVVRRPLFTQPYIGVVNGFQNSEIDYSADTNAVLGIKIHPGGVINDQTWTSFEHIVSIPQGLGALDLYGVLNPATTNPDCRLFCFVEVFPEGTNTQIATSIKCGPNEGTDNSSGKTSSEIYCEILPAEGAQWAKNPSRLLRGVGCWTLDALREANRVTEFIYTNAYRVTQPIRIAISPTYSGAHRLKVRWALQTGTREIPISGTYASLARLLYMMAIPSKGF